MNFEETSVKKLVTIGYEDLMSLKVIRFNRCGALTEEEAIELGYTKEDWNKLLSRANKLKATFIKRGEFKNEDSDFVIAKRAETDEYVLIEAQGRRKAVQMLHDESEEWRDKLSNMKFSCILYNDPLTDDEICDKMETLNVGNRNWGTEDKVRLDVMKSDDDEVISAFEERRKYAEKYGIGAMAVGKLFHGDSYTQSVSKGITHSTRTYTPYHNVYCDEYGRFLTEAGEGRSKKVLDSIRRSNFCLSIISVFNKIVDFYDGDYVAATPMIKKAVDAMVNFIKNSSDADVYRETNAKRCAIFYAANVIKQSKCGGRELQTLVKTYAVC